jgi:hypothetical protein
MPKGSDNLPCQRAMTFCNAKRLCKVAMLQGKDILQWQQQHAMPKGNNSLQCQALSACLAHSEYTTQVISFLTCGVIHASMQMVLALCSSKKAGMSHSGL